MTTFKFRGKCKDTGEIVTGSLLTLPNEWFIIKPAEFKSGKSDPNFRIIQDITLDGQVYKYGVKSYRVEPCSVKMLVGYDADSKELYETDTVSNDYNEVFTVGAFIELGNENGYTDFGDLGNVLYGYRKK